MPLPTLRRLRRGRLVAWRLYRPEPADDAPAPAPGDGSPRPDAA